MQAIRSYVELNQAAKVLRLASKDLETDSQELAYQCRLARKRLHQDRLALKASRVAAEDKQEVEA